ncbi:MAG: helix-turn-helix domain-containing protein, partial [Victivallales bacterium]
NCYNSNIMNELPAQKVDGLIDGMALLEELATHKEPVAGLELAKKLGMSPVRVNRLLKTFAYLGYA